MSKSPDAFRTISEVAEWLGVQAHVLRFWESKFTQVKPVKRAGGRRYYRPADMQLLGGIKKLLHDDGLTIKGVQKMLREQGIAQVADLSQPLEDGAGLVEEATPPLHDAPRHDAAQHDATPHDALPQDATVLDFRGASPREDAGVAGARATDDGASLMAGEDEVVNGDADGEEAEPRFPDLETTADIGSPPAPEPVPTSRPTGAEPAASLPSFMHRGSRSPAASTVASDIAPSESAPQDTSPPEKASPSTALSDAAPAGRMPPQPETEQTPEPPRARVIDAPDPPAEADMPDATGVLSKLAQLDRLPPDTANRIAPVAQELRAWLDRASATGIA